MDPAILIRRVEPVYPILAKMAHREGRIELRAIISTDGSIRSLEVISGDPLFVRASYDAVSQWRYRPLILNGQAVEVETNITVIFQLQR
jgi:protein TonB